MLFGDRHNQVKMKSLELALNQCDQCPSKEGKTTCEDRDAQWEGHVMTEAKFRVTQLQMEECQGLTAMIRS